MQKAKVRDLDIEELLIHILELNEDSDELYGDMENGLTDILDGEGNMVGFMHEMIRRIMPLVDVGESPLTKKKYRILGSNGLSFVKVEV